MAGRGRCASGAGAATIAVVTLLCPPPAPADPPPAAIRLLDVEAWGMGGSGIPIPPPSLIAEVAARYNPPTPIFAGQPLFDVTTINPLFTPEGLYPVTGVKSLPGDTSIAQGVQILQATILDRIAAGNDVVVVGASQSAAIAGLEMRNLLALPDAERPTADQLSFLLLGDSANPNGGLLERFGDPSLPPLSLPSLGITLTGATPSDTPWDTTVYTLEYDGFADYPRYPINLLADLNAVLGVALVHSTYPSLPISQLADTVELAVSPDYDGHTRYFMIPAETLPLLAPLQGLPVLGQPLVDLLQPALRVLVNLGYGNIEHGWDQGPADVPTPFGLFPDVDPGAVLTALGNGVRDGFSDFLGDLSHLSLPEATEPTETTDSMAAPDWSGVGVALPGLTDVANAFAGALAAGYSALLPTADILTAALTSVPMYLVGLAAQELAAGNLLEAVGMPIAATAGLGTMGIGFEAIILMQALAGITDAFNSLGGIGEIVPS